MKETKRKPGQPKKFGVDSRILSMRVPANKYNHYKEVFKNFLAVEQSVNCNINNTK